MKRVLFGVTEEASWAAELALTALRVFFGLTLALAHGLGKLPPSAGFIEGVRAIGLPAPGFFAWSAALAEVVGGGLLVLGLLTRPSAAFVAITMAVAAFGRHAADPFKMKELAFAYLVIALVFAVRGAGRLSVDWLVARGSRAQK